MKTQLNGDGTVTVTFQPGDALGHDSVYVGAPTSQVVPVTFHAARRDLPVIIHAGDVSIEIDAGKP